MKYHVTVSGRAFEVEVDGGRVTVDGTSLEAHLAAVCGTPLHHLLLAGGSWTVAAHAAGPPGGPTASWVIGAVGERFQVDVVDERTRAIQALTGIPQAGGGGGGGTVAAPMPGLVVRIEVQEGQRVEAGAGLVVVEAMKMENELRAPRAGVVSTVHVRVGQTVEKSAPLVTLESPEASG